MTFVYWTGDIAVEFAEALRDRAGGLGRKTGAGNGLPGFGEQDQRTSEAVLMKRLGPHKIPRSAPLSCA